MRLDRRLVLLSQGSRTQVQKLIRSGAVSVNGAPVRDPAASVSDGDLLAVGSAPLDNRLERHVLLYKPEGLLTAARDKKQETVMDLLPQVYTSLGCMPVGRLDKDTTGVLLLTTDGELNHRLLAPGRHVDKIYLARLDKPLGQEAIEQFAAGIPLEDFRAAPALLELPEPTLGRVTLHEGKFHQVKRMFEAVGATVLRLHREAFGPLRPDEGMQPGQWRELTTEEINSLRQCAGMECRNE